MSSLSCICIFITASQNNGNTLSETNRLTRQGERIPDFLIIRGSLISTSEQPYDSPDDRNTPLFTEENHGSVGTSNALPQPQGSAPRPAPLALGHCRHRNLRRHQRRQRLAADRHLRPATARLAAALLQAARGHSLSRHLRARL